MLIGFSVSNYRSFHERQIISFLASKITRHKNHVIEINNKKILKTGLIFGANAGGKSNLINSIAFSRTIICLGLERVNLEKMYFRISKSSYKEPATFEYRLLIDSIEYSYGIVISYEKKEIIAEWLSELKKSGEEKNIYYRSVDENNNSSVKSDICNMNENPEENTRLRIYLDDFGKNISPSFRKKTILNDLALRGNNSEGIFLILSKVFNWFKDMVVIFPHSRFVSLNDGSTDINRKSLFSKMIRYFDTGIEEIKGKKQETSLDKFLENIPKELVEKTKIDILNKLEQHPERGFRIRIKNQMFILRKGQNDTIMYNKIFLDHGNKDDLFEYLDESDGTKRLFDLLPLLSYETLSHKPSIILIDEIDRSFHSNLSKCFLEKFYETNATSNTQLISTTHDVNLLDLDLLRQDEIWFVERQRDHSSKIFSLNKFKERFDKKVDKEYLLGRYGAIPIFDNEALEDEQ